MINQRITKLRQLMKERGIDLYRVFDSYVTSIRI